MDALQNLFPPQMYDVLERSGICTLKEIITLSFWDIKKLTNMTNDDISLLKNIVATHGCPTIFTGDQLIEEPKLSTGCRVIDDLLNGGLQRGTITEIYGESGTGKTQLALQMIAHIADGAIYICTENKFPIKRFEQIGKNITGKEDLNICHGNNVHIEQITESSDLMACVKVRMIKLLEKKRVSLIIIDSIAAPFRVENTDYVQRAEDIRDLAVSLQKAAQRYNLAVVCINQVTSSFTEFEDVLPSLGLTWSHMISYRLFVRRTKIIKEYNDGDYCVRDITVIFAPDIANKSCQFIVTTKGIEEP
ncbi:unnamed protein product [Leptidea sinapis]|uniref:RecA family profile 1 domain-containing protein n=1 Tax=Leptidea sinapis TaxID=189913 RepID=A0A5E4Q242_9NEOP|nr:unnamed protein product [Leptidea sinapis]